MSFLDVVAIVFLIAAIGTLGMAVYNTLRTVDYETGNQRWLWKPARSSHSMEKIILNYQEQGEDDDQSGEFYRDLDKLYKALY